MTTPSRAYMPPSQTHDWATPKDFFDGQWVTYGPFDLDVCGQREHHYSAYIIDSHGGRCFDGSTEALDGLVQPWHCESAWMNPPHDKVALWVAKAANEVGCGNATRVRALLPVRTDTRWWQNYVMTGFGWCGSVRPLVREVHFLPGRLKFGNSKNSAPFPSAIVVWRAPLLAPPQPAAQEAMEL